MQTPLAWVRYMALQALHVGKKTNHGDDTIEEVNQKAQHGDDHRRTIEIGGANALANNEIPRNEKANAEKQKQ